MSALSIAQSKYTTDEAIQVLEGLEPVRKRPAMYIGDPDKKGLHHLAWEILDNAVDEYINGYADHATLTLHKSGHAITITDNGRGIPVDLHSKHKKTGLELVLTVLHAGAKFGESNSGYIRTGGLHGVGASVVNALSKKLVATVKRDGFEYRQEYAKGTPLAKVEKVGPSRGHGTSIYFEPDETIFKVTRFDPDIIRTRLEDMAYIHSGLHITYKNEISGETLEFTNSGGLPAFLTKLVADGQEPAVTESSFYAERETGDKIEVAIQWTKSNEETYRSYANGIRTPNGGAHENGLKNALRKAINNYMETHDIKVKGVKSITADDIREGVVVVLSVFLRDPMFESQNFVRPALEAWLNNNKSAADQVIWRITTAAQMREASRAAKEEVKRKAPGSKRLSLPGKLADCKSTDRDETELFIVEGDSAGGSAKQGRNNNTQAVLPLRGKIKNCEGILASKALENQEISDLVTAIGTGIGDRFNYDNLRYGKIILLMDADADGCHITTLMLDFLFRFMRELINKGHVYIAQPPLYRVNVGKDIHWVPGDTQKEELVEKLQKANRRFEVTRFKGLGEMDAKDLASTTLDRKTRTLLKVHIDNPNTANDAFVELLGEDAGPRYKFIMERAEQASAEELDV
jgi:DNA gyrase/topoisomerase IV subunit B